MNKAHSSGNGNQMRQLIREGKSASKALQAQIDRAVALADQEVGIGQMGSRQVEMLSQLPTSPSAHLPTVDRQPLNTQVTIPGGLPVAPTNAVPPVPPPEPISVAAYTERIRAGWVPVMGLP